MVQVVHEKQRLLSLYVDAHLVDINAHVEVVFSWNLIENLFEIEPHEDFLDDLSCEQIKVQKRVHLAYDHFLGPV